MGLVLNALAKSIIQGEKLKVGDIVKFKEGMKNTSAPDDEAVVIRVFDEPVKEPYHDDADSPYFNRILDIEIGVIDGDSDKFICFHQESRRFTKVGEIEL